jgi:uncharacterized protein (TIGR00255 family)
VDVMQMIKSMTGYGRYEGYFNDVKLTVEIKSVNQRFCEVSIRLPRHLMLFEDRLKRQIQEKIHRGRIDVFVSYQSDTLTKRKLSLDWDLAQEYLSSAQQLKERLQVDGDITVQDLLGIEGLFLVEEEDSDVEQYCIPLLHAVNQATLQLMEMREEEGNALAEDLTKRVISIRETVAMLTEYSPRVKALYQNRLELRMKEFLQDRAAIDEARIINEVAIFADRSNIDEELTRLASHCQQFTRILSLDEPVGRKLDFLVQEMNREANTIGSKANDIEISQHVVELKSNIEKMKEQVQNIE